MNKKTILSRTLPLIIALFVILIVAVCVVVFSGDKKTPMIESQKEDYLTIDLGYSTKVNISKGDIYVKLKNSDNGLTFLVNEIDSKLFKTEELKAYYDGVTEEQIKEAIQKDIFGKDYEFDPENTDSDAKKIDKFIENLFISYGISVKESSIVLENAALKVSLTGEEALVDYYTLTLAKKAYTREKMGEDQKTAYEEFIAAYEEYLNDLYEYEKDKSNSKPVAPAETSTIKVSNVQSDFESENEDSYWVLMVTYDTVAEAESALLQVGVVIYDADWYFYEGQIDLNDYKNDKGGKLYTSLTDYYSKKGVKLNKFEIQEKLIELYNNSKNPNTDEFLVEGDHYTVEQLTAAEYEALNDELKEEKYTEIKASEDAEAVYKAIIFRTEPHLNDEGEIDNDHVLNALYYTEDELSAYNSSLLSYIKNLTPLYTNKAVWSSCYSNSIQSRGDLQVLAMKLVNNTAIEFDSEEAYGTLYDEDAFDGIVESGKVEDLKQLLVGYVPYTRDEKGKLVFQYEENKYWEVVEKLLDDAVSTTKINEYMAKLRVEKGLIIYDEVLEKNYTSTYSSDYENTKKAHSSIVAKLTWKNEAGKKETLEISANDLYALLNDAFGAVSSLDAYQQQMILKQNEIIDYGKYLAGADLEDCVYVVEYALAKAGTTDPVTKWVKSNTDGEVVFKKVNGTEEYDLLVRKYVKGGDKAIEKFDAEAEDFDVEDDTASKTTITVSISDEVDYQDPETLFESYDDMISSLKISFSNGGFAEYGYDASYGWKNFIKDYFATYYGFDVESNDDLRLYFIYEDTVKNITEDLIKTSEELYNNIYLPYMQKAYNDYFSLDAFHFLISVSDNEGNMLDPEEEDTWTAEQKAAAEELYSQVLTILKKTPSSKQAQVLQDIADAFEAAPKFVAGVEQTTEAQQEHVKNNPIYDVTNDAGEVLGSVLEFTASFKGITINVSEYKTLGLEVTYQDLGNVTAGEMVERFEDAMKKMWRTVHIQESGLQNGESVSTVKFYDDFANGEFLVTEFGYHVVVATKFDAVPSKTISKITSPLRVPSFENIKIYEEDGKDVDDLLDLEIAGIEKYYAPVAKDFSSSSWYQLNMMLDVIEELENGNALTFVDEANKEKLLTIANYYVAAFYDSFTYITRGYDYAMDLMEIFTESYNDYALSAEKAADETYLNKFIISVEDLQKILTVAEKVLAEEIEMTESQHEEYLQLRAKYEEAKEAFEK